MVGRRGGVGGGDGGGHGVGEHGHELLVVKLIKLIASPRRPGGRPRVAAIVRGLEEGNGVADGSPVSAPLGGGEVEEFIDPGGVLRGGRRQVPHGRDLLVRKTRPVGSHGWDLWRQLRHNVRRNNEPKLFQPSNQKPKPSQTMVFIV